MPAQADPSVRQAAGAHPAKPMARCSATSASWAPGWLGDGFVASSKEDST